MGRRSRSGVAGWGIALLCVAAAALVAPSVASAQGEGKRILLYTGTTGFRHTDAINNGRPVVQTALQAIGFTVDWEDCTNNATTPGANNCNHADKNPRIFTDANLARYDAIVLLNASAGPPGPLWDAAAKAAIIKYMQNGGGIAAVHNATDMGTQQQTWDWWDGNSPNSAVGSLMAGHAATSLTNIAQVQVSDHNHLSTKDLPDQYGMGDEHYNFQRNVRGSHHVLATLDERTYNPGRQRQGPGSPDRRGASSTTAPTSTTTPAPPRTYSDGRVWVTGMGHFGASFTENGGNNNLRQDDRRRHPLGRGRRQEVRLLGHRVVELPPHGPGRRREPADRHRRLQGRQGLLERDGPARHRRQPVQLAGLDHDARSEGPARQQDDRRARS